MIIMIIMMKINNKCKKCGYEWISRKTNPKSCPNCKQYRWNISNNEK